MRYRLFIIVLFLFFCVYAYSQERPDSLSIKPDSLKISDEISEPTSIVTFPSAEFLILPRISTSPYQKFNTIQIMDLKNVISRNVYIHRNRYHFLANQNRHFLSSLMPGLILEPNLGPAPEFDYKIFLDPNFDPRVYTIPTIHSTFQNAQIFPTGVNPTDKINW